MLWSSLRLHWYDVGQVRARAKIDLSQIVEAEERLRSSGCCTVVFFLTGFIAVICSSALQTQRPSGSCNCTDLLNSKP